MVAVIREICIFMIIAQAILFFVPGSSYMKYVRVLVGIMMIMRITGPFFELFLEEGEKKEIADAVEALERKIDLEGKELILADNEREIYENIETELKNRLAGCESGYEVVDVRLLGNEGLAFEGEGEKIAVTVSEKKAKGEGSIRIEPVKLGEKETEKAEREQELKELYGSCIGVDAARIEIRLKQR